MTNDAELVRFADGGTRVELSCPVSMPHADAFLWNPHMLLQMNCQGYATAQHLQPEPAKYSHPPLLEQKIFMQPEQPYYAHHPGRFVYVKDETAGSLFSAPYAPVKRQADEFVFSAGDSDLAWRVRCDGLTTHLRVTLAADTAAELWHVSVTNDSDEGRSLSIYPSFSIGYMSWMNQSAHYDAALGAIVAASVTPYQLLSEFDAVRRNKDLTCLVHDTVPDSWETSLAAFEGEGGLHAPAGVAASLLGRHQALYETPTAVLQYRLRLTPGEQRSLRFVFGPARDLADVRRLRELLNESDTAPRRRPDRAPQAAGSPCLHIASPDTHFDAFVNGFLGRQVLYQGSVHRLTTDPQTRNFLQDALGMIYVDPAAARRALLTALAQQRPDGNMPEGIVLVPGAPLKYINQVPHTDHCVWLPVFLEAWLAETGDRALLDETLPGCNGRSVIDAVTAAVRWLVANRDARGLSFIAQGDWCDPMNMVGPAGKGVSGWLTIATVHALRLWARICDDAGRAETAAECRVAADESSAAAGSWLWDGNWYARGITDAGTRFGVSDDAEGRLYLNPQSWAILAGIAGPEQVGRMLAAIDEQLATPVGMQMLAPAYTGLREDIGRLTQKFPGTAENGSVYNHAAAFYVAALYALGDADRAWDQLRRALPGPERQDYLRRGQLPVYLPNYYRGAWRQFPAAAGRSSRLCHTGAAPWLYRLVIEGLFGLRGCRDGLSIAPALPSHWRRAEVTRRFREALFEVSYSAAESVDAITVSCDGRRLPDGIVRDIRPGAIYRVEVACPVVAVARPETAVSTAHSAA